MSDNLFDDETVHQRVLAVWEQVFKASSSVLKHAKQYGFLGMELIPNPNIHSILKALKILESIFDEILTFDDLPYDEKRLILNARVQFTHIERVAAALNAGNREDFEKAICAIQGQAAF